MFYCCNECKNKECPVNYHNRKKGEPLFVKAYCGTKSAKDIKDHKGGRKMLIRSQNKAVLLNFSNWAAIYTVKDGADFIISSLEGENRYRIGKYSSEAKAMKVLDMIQEAYADFESAKITSTGLAAAAYTGSYDTPESVAHGIKALRGYAEMIRESVVFQMPEDGSVEP